MTRNSFDNMGPAYQAIPEFLKENKYADVTDVTNAPLQKAWNTSLPAFLWVQTRPDGFAYFNQWMAAQREFMPTWLDVYPVEEESKNVSPGAPLFVDIGGGLGHQCIALVKKYPQLPGRVILQDIPATLEHAIKHDGVEIMVQDFFQPQTIKGKSYTEIQIVKKEDHFADSAAFLAQVPNSTICATFCTTTPRTNVVSSSRTPLALWDRIHSC